jgi:hypothetical protein
MFLLSRLPYDRMISAASGNVKYRLGTGRGRVKTGSFMAVP